MTRAVHTVAELRAAVRDARAGGRSVGLVPTMGALHAGHLSLIHRARAECDFVAVSLFVNPTQFGPKEDLARYPRDFPGDLAAAREAGADLLFAPPVEEMYPPGDCTAVEVAGPARGFEGASRPGHFRGVATVVAKLFLMALPDRAYFGEKDYQQLQVVRRMVRDLSFPLEVVACPTVREADGLALSSRNRYLSPEERAAAPALRRALLAAAAAYSAGEREAATLVGAASAVLAAEPRFVPDYLALADAESLEPCTGTVTRPAVLLAAARLGNTRLIDSLVLGRPVEAAP